MKKLIPFLVIIAALFVLGAASTIVSRVKVINFDGTVPGSPANGDLWYSTADNTLSARINGSTVVISQNIGGFTAAPTSILTCDTAGGYVFGDNWSGLVTITNALRANGSSGLVSTFTYLSNDDTSPELNVLVFSRPVTLVAANAAFLVSGADMAYSLGSFRVTAQDYTDLGTNRMASRLNLNFAVNNTYTNRNIYLAFITQDATQVCTNQPVCTLGILQD